MAMGDLTLFATPSAGSAIVTTLSANGYARVVGKSADNWSKLDLSDSSQPQAATAWLNPNDGNFSGACDNLPTAD
jgi:transcription elongation factor